MKQKSSLLAIVRSVGLGGLKFKQVYLNCREGRTLHFLTGQFDEYEMFDVLSLSAFFFLFVFSYPLLL